MYTEYALKRILVEGLLDPFAILCVLTGVSISYLRSITLHDMPLHSRLSKERLLIAILVVILPDKKALGLKSRQ